MKRFGFLAALLVLSACSVKPNVADSPVLNGPGNLPVKDEIRNVIKSNIKDVRGCYEKALDRNLKVQGKLVAEWRINGDGTVTDAVEKQSTLNDPEMVKCILGKIGTWKFSPPPEDQIQVISYPFVFKSHQ